MYFLTCWDVFTLLDAMLHSSDQEKGRDVKVVFSLAVNLLTSQVPDKRFIISNYITAVKSLIYPFRFFKKYKTKVLHSSKLFRIMSNYQIIGPLSETT
jgi:hypothetical protein